MYPNLLSTIKKLNSIAAEIQNSTKTNKSTSCFLESSHDVFKEFYPKWMGLVETINYLRKLFALFENKFSIKNY